MISSTRADLAQYSTAASDVISKVAAEKEKWVQLLEVSMEKEVQSGEREFAVAVSKRWVEGSDWVVVILGWNYGTVSDEAGADGLSVTEWEYRHALKLGKKLYVFIAGDPQTANQYRVSDEEKEDLKDWIPRQAEAQTQKLKEFKKELYSAHVETYANLQRFRERLEKTLKDAIDDLPPKIQPGTPLAEVIVAVIPDLRDCIRRVRLVADCKKIHDHLHELHQHVISPLRAEVLSVWQQEGTLSVNRERAIWRCMNKMAAALGGIRALRPSIGPGNQPLRNSVDAVLQRPALWNIESVLPEPRPSREEFTELVDDFAIDVEEAFSEADRSMAKEESALNERYVAWRQNLKRARQQRMLSFSDQQRLDDELEKGEHNRERVKDSLIEHHAWQEAHDKLEELGSFRQSGDLEKKLKHYRRVRLGELISLVDRELGESETHQGDSSATEHAAIAAVVQYAQPTEPSLQGASDAFVKDLRYLKEALEALRQGAGVEVFDEMRKHFDDAFYYVDKKTLSEVERAQERAINLGDWIDGLVSAQKKTVGDSHH